MPLHKNIYAILDNSDLSDDESELEFNDEPELEQNSGQMTLQNKLKFSKKRKQFTGKNKFNKHIKHDKHNKTNKKIFRPTYNEMDDLPRDFADAIEKKQNLTLKQILVLMELQAIPGLVLNTIHDKLQLKVKRSPIKISHDSRVFYVSYYNWYDLDLIEKMIDSMLFSS